MRSEASDFPCLTRFLEDYMHQDWRLFGGTLEDVLIAYAQDGSSTDLPHLRAEIGRFLAKEAAPVEQTYRRLYPNAVRPEAWNMTAEAWLQRIADLTLQGAH